MFAYSQSSLIDSEIELLHIKLNCVLVNNLCNLKFMITTICMMKDTRGMLAIIADPVVDTIICAITCTHLQQVW